MLILGISGKKQSGKTTSANFIASIFMTNLNISQKIYINDNGEMVISDLFDNKLYAGVFDLTKAPYSNDFLIKKTLSTLNPEIKLYSFADPLKQDICIDILGLTWEQCYGSDADKNSKTSLKWEDMPTSEKNKKGFMTAREVMEYVGTDIFRKMKLDSWVSATMKKILNDKPKLAIIIDCRFPDEVNAIKNANGKIIRLSRDKFNSSHKSEMALNENEYDWSNFDFIIRNDNMSIYDQCIQIQNILQNLNT